MMGSSTAVPEASAGASYAGFKGKRRPPATRQHAGRGPGKFRGGRNTRSRGKGGRGRELKSRVCTHEKGLVSQPTKERPPRFGGRYGARRSDKWKENARADENWSGVVAAGEADAVETGTSVAHASNKWAAAIAKVHSRMDGDGAEQGWVRR